MITTEQLEYFGAQLMTRFEDRLQNFLQQIINPLPGNYAPSNNQNANPQEEHLALPQLKGVVLHPPLEPAKNKYTPRKIKSQATIFLPNGNFLGTDRGKEEEVS